MSIGIFGITLTDINKGLTFVSFRENPENRKSLVDIQVTNGEITTSVTINVSDLKELLNRL